ncbi:DUF6365 family protein [Streptomyces heilongjiangensis]|uniref:DUF6365 family protein n=1 Tax=Streptomyces heilongjiangensis TaxID=945052 RepID=A0ABW1BAZ6_9ACTN|nr:DUF6365 family protein [Streptomyces heilongjiangensis]MDC2948768.1 DUF6365 family protein [Streptomyces heilongjiangensis]
MRLLFLSMLAQTLHETTVGVDLANRLKGDGVESHFVVDAYNEAQIRAAGHGWTIVGPELGHRVRDAVARVVRSFAPDAIVLSDYLAHWVTHRVNYETDPWYVQDLGVPVIPMDLYDLGSTAPQVDLLGRPAVIDENYRSMPVRLLPVPVNRPQDPSGPQAVPYRANPVLRPPTTARRDEVRRSLGARHGERLLLFPTLPWQYTMQTRAAPLARETARRLPRLLGHYLRRLPRSTRFVMLGPYFEGLGLPADRVHIEPVTTVRRYHDVLGAVDAVASAFLTSYALERAILVDVPGLLTVNSHRVDGPAGTARLAGALGGLTPGVRTWLDGFPGVVDTFYGWPLRWTEFLQGVLRDNPFTDTVVRTEVFDERSVVSGLEAVLYDPAERDRLAAVRAGYRDALDKLPDPAGAFRAAADQLGIQA